MHAYCTNSKIKGCAGKFITSYTYAARYVAGGYMVQGDDGIEYMFYDSNSDKSPKFFDFFTD